MEIPEIPMEIPMEIHGSAGEAKRAVLAEQVESQVSHGNHMTSPVDPPWFVGFFLQVQFCCTSLGLESRNWLVISRDIHLQVELLNSHAWMRS